MKFIRRVLVRLKLIRCLSSDSEAILNTEEYSEHEVFTYFERIKHVLQDPFIDFSLEDVGKSDRRLTDSLAQFARSDSLNFLVLKMDRPLPLDFYVPDGIEVISASVEVEIARKKLHVFTTFFSQNTEVFVMNDDKWFKFRRVSKKTLQSSRIKCLLVPKVNCFPGRDVFSALSQVDPALPLLHINPKNEGLVHQGESPTSWRIPIYNNEEYDEILVRIDYHYKTLKVTRCLNGERKGSCKLLLGLHKDKYFWKCDNTKYHPLAGPALFLKIHPTFGESGNERIPIDLGKLGLEPDMCGVITVKGKMSSKPTIESLFGMIRDSPGSRTHKWCFSKGIHPP